MLKIGAMRTKFTPLSVLLLLVVLSVSAHAKGTGPQPEQGDNSRYDLGSANLSIFKLFTVQPEKKSNVNRQMRSKAPAHKVESDKKELIYSAPPAMLDRLRR